MADMAFHSEAIERLCFACGNIIMKNAHLIEPSLFQNIIEMRGILKAVSDDYVASRWSRSGF